MIYTSECRRVVRINNISLRALGDRAPPVFQETPEVGDAGTSRKEFVLALWQDPECMSQELNDFF